MMTLGDFPAGGAVYFKWNTQAIAGESITRATNGTIRVYKDGSTNERSSSAGITDTEDFDTLVGVHHCTIDLSDNTDAGFYAAGHEYDVVLAGAVIDGKTMNTALAHFSIQRTNGVLSLLTDATNGLAAIRAVVDAINTAVDTEVAAIKAKTDNLPPDPADASDILSVLSTIQGFVDTEVAAIKAKTDALPAAPAAVGDIPTTAQITTAVFARAFSAAYGNKTFDELVKGMSAILLGRASGLGGTTATFRNLANNADVVVATVDSDGNRTAVTFTP